MPIVAHNDLPSLQRLREAGTTIVLPQERAARQDIRELHIGLLNMMPDAALEATERQFFRLIGESNPIAQFYVHPFTLDAIPRGAKAADEATEVRFGADGMVYVAGRSKSAMPGNAALGGWDSYLQAFQEKPIKINGPDVGVNVATVQFGTSGDDSTAVWPLLTK